MTLSNDDLQWLGIDFDGVLCQTSHPDYEMGEPLSGAVESMQKLQADGWKLTIFTARPWVDYQAIEEWLDRHQIPHRRIICGKPLFKYMVDDRNIAFDGDWESTLSKIK